MARLPYDDLPARVRHHVAGVLGSPVVQSWSQVGGFSPGVAARVRCADGSRAFVKAVSSLVDPQTPGMHRTEAVVTAQLPPELGSPRLLGSYDDGTWVALVLEDVEGRPPALPDDLPAVLAALDRLAEVPAPADLPPVADALADDFQGWQRLAEAPPADLTPWQRGHVDRLVALESRWAQAAAGQQLLHLDLRTDNMLLRADGTVVLVDWPWAAAGAPVLDLVALVPSAVLEGAGDPEALLLSTRTGRTTEPAAVTCLLAAFCGRMEEHARRPPLPALPRVRDFQAAQARAAGAWLQRRTGWA